jgi:hypothetical protein
VRANYERRGRINETVTCIERHPAYHNRAKDNQTLNIFSSLPPEVLEKAKAFLDEKS